MTTSKLLQICKENGSPSNPLAVTRLELNCQLFTCIEPCVADFPEVGGGGGWGVSDSGGGIDLCMCSFLG